MESNLTSTSLTTLEIGYSMMGDEGALCFSKIISKNPNLKIMDVFNPATTSAGFEAILGSLQSITSLISLVLINQVRATTHK